MKLKRFANFRFIDCIEIFLKNISLIWFTNALKETNCCTFFHLWLIDWTTDCIIWLIKGKSHLVNEPDEKNETQTQTLDAVGNDEIPVSGTSNKHAMSNTQQHQYTEEEVLLLQKALEKARADLKLYEGRL